MAGEQQTKQAKRKYPFHIENPIEEGRIEKVLETLKAVMDVDIYKRPLSIYLDTCARCNNCAEGCHVYRATRKPEDLPAYRSELLRRIHKKYFTASGKILGGLVGAKALTEEDIDVLLESVYRCTMCRRCNLECPMGIDNALLARIGRVILASLNLAPANFTASVRSQLEGAGFNTSAIPKAAFIDTLEFLNEEIEEATGRDMGFPMDRIGAEILFVAPVSDFITEAETLMGNAMALHTAGADWTVGTEFYDAINYGLFYSDEYLGKILKKICEEAERLKVKKIIVGECGHATKVLKLFPQIFEPGANFEVENILQFTARAIREGKIKLDPSKNTKTITYHDPCNLGRMGGVLDEPREIIRAAARNFVEMEPTREANFCCGGGGGSVTVPDIKEFRMNVAGKMKADQIRASGAELVAAPCANCKKQISELIEYHNIPAQVIGVHDLLIEALVLEPAEQKAGADKEAAPDVREPRKKILIIDDEKDIRMYLSTLLGDNGYDTIEAASCNQGIRLAQQERPDLITLDLMMPKRTGARFYWMLRKDKDIMDIPVIIVSGLGPEEQPRIDLDQFVKKQNLPPPNGFIEKPIDKEKILGTIRESFNG